MKLGGPQAEDDGGDLSGPAAKRLPGEQATMFLLDPADFKLDACRRTMSEVRERAQLLELAQDAIIVRDGGASSMWFSALLQIEPSDASSRNTRPRSASAAGFRLRRS